MQSALRITTKVLPGNRIEVQLPLSSEGQEVEVFIVLPILTVPLTLSNQSASLVQITEEPNSQVQLAITQSTEALARIRSRSRLNPLNFGLSDSTDLICEDRHR
jgi:hypothetical protein